MIGERICMRALPVKFLFGRLGGLGFLLGFAVVFALLALGWGRVHFGGYGIHAKSSWESSWEGSV